MKSSEPLFTDSDVFNVEHWEGIDHKKTAQKSSIRSTCREHQQGKLSRSHTRHPRSHKFVTFELASNKSSMPYGYGRQQPKISTGLVDLNLPMNPSNVLTPMFPAPITEARSYRTANDNIPIQEEPFDNSGISKPSMMVNSVNAWETSSDMGTFYSDEPRRVSLASCPSSTSRKNDVSKKERVL